MMTDLISIIIPNYNASKTIQKCLESVYQSRYPSYEVIVVDDYSLDNSIDIIKRFPCQLIRLEQHQGAAYARNRGVEACTGNILFFTDSDCLLLENTLSLVQQNLRNTEDTTIIGGTYTPRPYDADFFSTFQSAFIHYSETKSANNPDYIATHALGMWRDHFDIHNGFDGKSYPILEDVEYSHRLKRDGVRLVIIPQLMVQHIFNFSLLRSLKNAFRKSKYWTAYSIESKGIFSDSGTASYELKLTVVIALLNFAALILSIYLQDSRIGLFILLNCCIAAFVNKRFLKFICDYFGNKFTVLCIGYYFFIYPFAIAAGSLSGIFHYFKKVKLLCTLQ